VDAVEAAEMLAGGPEVAYWGFLPQPPQQNISVNNHLFDYGCCDEKHVFAVMRWGDRRSVDNLLYGRFNARSGRNFIYYSE
jgi:hypothetical protein